MDIAVLRQLQQPFPAIVGKHEFQFAAADAAAEFLLDQQLQIFFIIDYENFDGSFLHGLCPRFHSVQWIFQFVFDRPERRPDRCKWYSTSQFFTNTGSLLLVSAKGSLCTSQTCRIAR